MSAGMEDTSRSFQTSIPIGTGWRSRRTSVEPRTRKA